MDFVYDAGANAPSSIPAGYAAGSRYYEADLLKRITVSVSGAVKRNYVLTYENSPTTTAKRLTQVKECSDPGATPRIALSPTTITYQNGSAGVNTGTPALSVASVIYATGGYDFDGNGIQDLLYYRSGTWYVRMGVGPRAATVQSTAPDYPTTA